MHKYSEMLHINCKIFDTYHIVCRNIVLHLNMKQK